MIGTRSVLRGTLFVGLAAAVVGKLTVSVQGPVLGGTWGTAAALMVEVVTLALLLWRKDAAAGLLVCGLCACGVVLAYLQPGARCGCFGVGVERTGHLMFAGTFGVVASALAWLAWPQPRPPGASFATTEPNARRSPLTSAHS